MKIIPNPVKTTHRLYYSTSTLTVGGVWVKKRPADVKSKSNQSSPTKSSTNIIQWNVQWIANMKAELADLIAKVNPDILCIQETMLSKQINFNLKNYNGLLKEGHTNYRGHGGVAIFIHETFSHQKLILDTRLQAIAARINMWKEVIIVSIYKSRSHAISENLLQPSSSNYLKL